MQVTGYQRAVDLKPLQTPEVKASKDLTAYGGNQFGTGMMADAMGKALDVSMKMAEEKMVTDVTAANTEYQKRLSDAMYGENGLMRRQQKGAEGIDTEFQDIERNVRNEVAKQYKLTSQRALRAFGSTADRDAASRYDLIRKHQFVQGEQYKDTELANNQNETIDFAGKNFADDVVVAEAIAKGNSFIAARYAGQGESVIKANQTKYKNSLMATVFNSAVNAGDYDTAEKLSIRYRDIIPSDLLAKTGKMITEYRKENDNIVETEEIYKQYGGNIDEALKGLRGKYTQPVNGSAIVNAMRSQIGIPYELGGDGVSSTDCGQSIKIALNKAGVKWNSRYVPYMIDEAKEKGLWRSPDSGYTPKAGDLAVVDGDNHIVMYDGKGGTIQAGVSTGKVYESAKSPEQMFGNITGWIAVGSSGNRVSPKDLKDKEDALIAYHQRVKGLETARKTEFVKAGESAIWQAVDSGVTDPKVLDGIARQYANGEFSVYKSLVGDVKWLLDSNKRSLTSEQKMKLYDMIETGEIIDRDVLKQEVMINGNYEDLKEIMSLFDNVQKKEGRYSFDWKGMKQQAFATWGTKDESIWFYSKQAGDEFISEYKKKNNGQLPTQYEVQQKIIEAGTKPKTAFWGNGGYNTTWENNGLSQADMRYFGLSDITTGKINGETKYVLHRTDGKEKIMSDIEFKAWLERVKRKDIN